MKKLNASPTRALMFLISLSLLECAHTVLSSPQSSSHLAFGMMRDNTLKDFTPPAPHPTHGNWRWVDSLIRIPGEAEDTLLSTISDQALRARMPHLMPLVFEDLRRISTGLQRILIYPETLVLHSQSGDASEFNVHWQGDVAYLHDDRYPFEDDEDVAIHVSLHGEQLHLKISPTPSPILEEPQERQLLNSLTLIFVRAE